MKRVGVMAALILVACAAGDEGATGDEGTAGGEGARSQTEAEAIPAGR